MLSKKLVLVSLIVGYIAYRNTFKNSNAEKAKAYGPTVETGNGLVRGIVSLSRDGREIYEYLGVPYAKAERFEVPKPADKWTGVRDAGEYAAKCLQMGMLIGNIDGEEDCLFLNVFVPKTKPSSRLPVLVFVHGGHFTEGASDAYRPDFFLDQDVILVTINYRLGILGFLNTGDGVVRGNMGLKDQAESFRWVKQNIANFGGDPSKITIFGESAGAASIHYHVISQYSKGLFSKAISMSGLSVKPWAFMATPKQQALRYGKRVSCPTATTMELVACLRKMSGYDLVAAHNDILETPRQPISVFVPSLEKVVDEHTFLAEEPKDILAKGNINKVPFLTGVNSHEGLIASASIVGRIGALEQCDKDAENVFPPILYLEKNDEQMRQIRNQYFGKGTAIDSIASFDNYTSLISDRHFFTHFEKAIKLQAKHAKTFVYYYTHPTEFTLTPILMALRGRFPLLVELLTHLMWSSFTKNVLGIVPFRYGICHADELALFFHIPGLTNVQPGHQDYEFSKTMVKLWVDFVNDENSMEFMGTKWTPVDREDNEQFKYMHLDTNSTGFIIPPFRQRLKFWEELNI